MRGSILRGWKEIVAHGYAAVYQDCRGRHGSEGEDRVYADDAADGFDTLDWIAAQPWCNGMVGMSGSSAGATTTFAAASTRHPSLRAFFAQAGASSIYDDVVYEGQSIEMERLWLWVARNIPGLSQAHRAGGHAALRHRARRTRPGRRRRPRRATSGSTRRATPIRPLSAATIGSPAAQRLSRFRDRPALSRRDPRRIPHPTPSAPRIISAARSTFQASTSRPGSTSSRPASSPPSTTSRRAPAHRNCGSARTSITSSMPAISGRATRISNGSATG